MMYCRKCGVVGGHKIDPYKPNRYICGKYNYFYVYR